VKPSVFWWYFVTDIMRSGHSGWANPVSMGGRRSIVSFTGGGVCMCAVIGKSVSYA